MGTLIPTRGSNFLPTVNTRNKVGETFTGKLVNKREVKTGYGSTTVYEFEALGGTMPIQKREGETWQDVDVDEGAHVEVFGGTRLRYAFDQLAPGVIVSIKYLGLGAKPKRGGNKPHEYEVEIG